MGTHPIFESDFDCLTDFSKVKKWRACRQQWSTSAPVILNSVSPAIPSQALFFRLKLASENRPVSAAKSIKDWTISTFTLATRQLDQITRPNGRCVMASLK